MYIGFTGSRCDKFVFPNTLISLVPLAIMWASLMGGGILFGLGLVMATNSSSERNCCCEGSYRDAYGGAVWTVHQAFEYTCPGKCSADGTLYSTADCSGPSMDSEIYMVRCYPNLGTELFDSVNWKCKKAPKVPKDSGCCCQSWYKKGHFGGDLAISKAIRYDSCGSGCPPGGMRYDFNFNDYHPLLDTENCSSSPSSVGDTYRICHPYQGINRDAYAWGWHDLKFITGPVCRGGPPDKDEYLENRRRYYSKAAPTANATNITAMTAGPVPISNLTSDALAERTSLVFP